MVQVQGARARLRGALQLESIRDDDTTVPLPGTSLADQIAGHGDVVDVNTYLHGWRFHLHLHIHTCQTLLAGTRARQPSPVAIPFLDTTIACPIEADSCHYLRNGLAYVGRVTV